jgi:uncharacterized protein YjiS (DUF1127 family)
VLLSGGYTGEHALLHLGQDMGNPENGTHHSPIDHLTRWWRSWTGKRAARAELEKLDTRQMTSITRDVGASGSELYLLAGKWPDSAGLLTRRMAALRLDHAGVAQSLPAVTRDMSKMCSLCGDKSRCERDLDKAAITPSWQRYCPNSTALVSLVAQHAADRRS